MTRTDILNELITLFKYSTYLELGTYRKADNFDLIQARHKICVDINPSSKPTFKGSTDDFFKQNKRTFDLIFVDADHDHRQVEKDIENSLNALSEGGTIVCHDMNPTTFEMQKVPRETGIWTGDCWKAFLKFRERPDLFMCVLDTDYGCGIIRKGKQTPIKVENPTYEQFTEHKKEWLNLIPVDLEPVSIVIPAFEQYGHGKKTLSALLTSIQRLRGKFEVIVSDNSPDDSIQPVCESFQVKYFKNPKRGISENTNAAIEAASYDLIKPMYQDDLFLSSLTIPRIAFALKLFPWVGISGSVIGEKGEVKRPHTPKFTENIIRTGKNTFGMPSVVAFRKNGIRFDTRLKTMLDCDFYQELYTRYGPPGIIQGNYIGSRYWDGSTSRNQGSYFEEEKPYLMEKWDYQ